jgi:hypothetical protein
LIWWNMLATSNNILPCLLNNILMMWLEYINFFPTHVHRLTFTHSWNNMHTWWEHITQQNQGLHTMVAKKYNHKYCFLKLCNFQVQFPTIQY